MTELIEIIKSIAQIPSFSGMEDRLFALIKNYLADNTEGYEILYAPSEKIVHPANPFGSMIVKIPGNKDAKPVALCAHLDKIDNWNGTLTETDRLDFSLSKGKIHGKLDDSIGVGICLYLAVWAQKNNSPPLYLLLSENEEIGMVGAIYISEFLDNHDMQIPDLFINIDTSPVLNESYGTAIYLSGDGAQKAWIKELCCKYKLVPFSDKRNDWFIYNSAFPDAVSFALEPGITNLHQTVETCRISDIECVATIIKEILTKESEGDSS